MNEIEQIKERLDIIDIISNYLTLKKAGANFKANCPFHNEKTPSFMVSPERQTFKCFGCGEGGDIFTFIEKMEGIDFFNALKILADRAGIPLKKQSVNYGEREYKSDKKTRVFEINDWTKRLYHKILTDHPKADNAKNYLKDRGLFRETIEEFEIGYAPDSWELLVKFLKQKGYTEEEMVQAGVVIRNEKKRYYDRFRGRIVFPINNIMGLTVAFTSRVLKDDPKQAKYINSSESPIYIKGKTIYGLDKAKMPIKEAGIAVFVEGNMDVITCHQAGFKNVVASSGTAITEEQLKILNRYSNEIAFSFDKDEAGEAAMKRAIKISLQNDINSKIISLSGPFKDPDEAIKKDPKNWERAVKEAKPSLEYWIDLLVRKDPALSVLTKKRIAKEILPIIKIIFSDIEKEYYIKYLARKLSVTEKAILNALEKTKEERDGQKSLSAEEVRLKPEEKILAIIWQFPDLLNEEELRKFSFEEFSDQEFIQMVQRGKVEKELVNPKTSSTLDQLALIAFKDFNSDKESNKLELKYLLGKIRSGKKEELKKLFAQKIQQAEDSGSKMEVKKLLEEFSTLIK